MLILFTLLSFLTVLFPFRRAPSYSFPNIWRPSCTVLSFPFYCLSPLAYETLLSPPLWEPPPFYPALFCFAAWTSGVGVPVFLRSPFLRYFFPCLSRMESSAIRLARFTNPLHYQPSVRPCVPYSWRFPPLAVNMLFPFPQSFVPAPPPRASPATCECLASPPPTLSPVLSPPPFFPSSFFLEKFFCTYSPPSCAAGCHRPLLPSPASP